METSSFLVVVAPGRDARSALGLGLVGGGEAGSPGLGDGGFSERRTNAESAESPYGCIITTLLSEEESDKAYRHRPFYVTFPEETVLEAQGQTEVVALFYTDEHAPARAKRRGPPATSPF